MGQAEAELERQRSLLGAIVDHAPSLIYMFDTEGRLRLGNRLFEKVMAAPAPPWKDCCGRASSPPPWPCSTAAQRRTGDALANPCA